jgi:hypothetical protein
MEIPQTGGTFIRDPKTGELRRQAEHTVELAAEAATDDAAPPAAAEPQAASEAPADEPTRKKVK